MLIDIHSHIGDILNPGGGRLIYQKGVPDRNLFDRPTKALDLIDAGFWTALTHYKLDRKTFPTFFEKWNVLSSFKRNSSATHENFSRSMTGSGMSHACCLPVPPYVTFEDILEIKDGRIIPFTGIDFTKDLNPEEQFERQVEAGACGLKLHPILQRMTLTDDKTRRVVEAFGKYELPILFHSGKTGYYPGKDSADRRENQYGNIDDARTLIASYPNIPFVIGHAGLAQVDEVIEKLSRYDNAYVDTSFQPPHKIKELISSFGTNRVMFASDWPYGSRSRSMEVAKKACGGDEDLERKLFCDNSRQLLKLN